METVVAILSVPPLGSVRSPKIEASEGQILVVRASVDDELTPAVFIYDTDGQLYAKNDENAESATFDWQVTESRLFEIVIYSNTDAAVDYSVIRLPIPTDRYVKGKTPPLATMNLFWASNRKLATRSPVTLDSKMSEGNRLVYGTCQVSIPRVHKAGLIEGPSILRLEFGPDRFDTDKHVVFLRDKSELLEPAQFFYGLQKYTFRSTENDALVFIHGFNVDFETAARRAAQLSYDLTFQGPTLVFTWPSKASLDPISYNADRTNAELSAEPLRNLLADLRKKSGIERIHIVAHSMGNVALAYALAGLKDASGIRQIALLAPDLDARIFETLARRFPERSKRNDEPRVTLYASDHDGALIVSRIYAGARRAGQGGPEIVLVPGIDSIDASHVDTSLLGVFHQYFADNTRMLGELVALLRGDHPAKRFGLKLREIERGTYYEFVPAAR